jgi:hypothetical protein
MSNYLFLEHHTVEDSFLFDTAMLLIKQSSEGSGVHFNSIGKPNRMFAWFVIDFLAMSMLFDSLIDHCLLMAPMPFKKTPLSEEHCGMLVHNKHIIIKFCLGQGLARINNFFLNEKTGDAGRGGVDLDKLWSTSTKFYCQLHAGIISSFESYTDSYTSLKKEQRLWIHHFVILQLFHPLFHVHPGEECKYEFKDNNHHLFVERMSDTQLEVYMKLYGGSPNYSLVWLGEGEGM